MENLQESVWPSTLYPNSEPVIRRYGIFEDAGPDMYLKGWAVEHMIRVMMNNDKMFRSLLRGLNRELYHETVSSKQIEAAVSKRAVDLTTFFS